MGSIGRFTSLFSLLRGVFPLFSPTLAVSSSFRQERRNFAHPLCSRPRSEDDGCALGTGGAAIQKEEEASDFSFQ